MVYYLYIITCCLQQLYILCKRNVILNMELQKVSKSHSSLRNKCHRHKSHNIIPHIFVNDTVWIWISKISVNKVQNMYCAIYGCLVPEVLLAVFITESSSYYIHRSLYLRVSLFVLYFPHFLSIIIILFNQRICYPQEVCKTVFINYILCYAILRLEFFCSLYR